MEKSIRIDCRKINLLQYTHSNFKFMKNTKPVFLAKVNFAVYFESD